MDPLSLLQAHLQKGQSIQIDFAAGETTVAVGEVRLPKKTLTAFRKRGGAENDYYTVEEIAFFSKFLHMPNDRLTGTYKREAISKRIRSVDISDLEELRDYLLHGRVSDKIDKMVMQAQAAATALPNGDITHTQLETEIVPLSVAEMQEERRKYAASLDEFLVTHRQSSAPWPEFVHETPYLSGSRKEMFSKVYPRLLDACSSETVIRKPGLDLSDIMTIYNDQAREYVNTPSKRMTEVKAHDSDKKRHKTSAAAPVTSKQDVVQSKSAETGKSSLHPIGPPIILVSNVQSTVLGFLNARDLLADASFVPMADKINQKREEKRCDDSVQTFVRVCGPDKLLYEIRNETSVNDKDWERVVALFAIGQAWQFKALKYKEPVELFQNVLGIHVQWDDHQVTRGVENWNVKVVRIAKSKRHLDSVAHRDIWRYIDEWVERNKPWIINNAKKAASQSRNRS